MTSSRRSAFAPPILLVPVLLAVGLGIGGLLGCGGKDAGGSTGGSAPGGGPPGRPGGGGARVIAVQVARAELGTIARSLSVSGVVEPIRTVGVNSQMSGALLAVEAEEGNQVSRGQLLARLDDRELRAQQAAAEAAFQVAESAHTRAQQLRDRQVITLPEYERDRTAYAAAKAELDQIRARLDYATITAPITGVITDKLVEAGDVVGAQSRLFSLADLSTMVVPLQVSELDVVSLSVGNTVQVGLDAFPERELQGTIRRIFPGADPSTRLVPVEVALEGDSAHLARPGFLARVTFALGERRNVLLVPASAIVGGGQNQAVFVVEEGLAHRREVSTGLISKGQVEILTGLVALDTVVTAGNNTLQDGAAVRVLERNRAGADSAAPAAPAAPAPQG